MSSPSPYVACVSENSPLHLSRWSSSGGHLGPRCRAGKKHENTANIISTSAWRAANGTHGIGIFGRTSEDLKSVQLRRTGRQGAAEALYVVCSRTAVVSLVCSTEARQLWHSLRAHGEGSVRSRVQGFGTPREQVLGLLRRATSREAPARCARAKRAF